MSNTKRNGDSWDDRELQEKVTAEEVATSESTNEEIVAEEEDALEDDEDKHVEPLASAENSGSTAAKQPDNDVCIGVHLGVVINPDEYTSETINFLKKNLLTKRSVKFCSEQFNDRTIHFNIVGLDVMPDAVTALLDEAIDDNGELNKQTYVNSVNIVVDIGSGTTDMASIQGFDIIPDSERQFNIGTNDAFTDIAQEVERKFNCGYIETSYISNVVRFPIGVCPDCGAVSVTSKECSCGREYEMKRNMIKIGQKAFDISDIVNTVYNDKADNLANIFKRYLDTLFKVRGINRSALDTVLIVGGGSELFGKILKERLRDIAGEYVEIKKASRAIWKSLNGLSKYVLHKKGKGKKPFNRYVFIDVGNFATKAKLVDTNDNEIGKPVELMTRIATPVKLGEITLRKAHPMMDLWLEISSEGEASHPGDGSYFVSHLANKGKNMKLRNSLTPKTTDEMFYVMINSIVGVLLARDKTLE
jgi:hypothetical protein